MPRAKRFRARFDSDCSECGSTLSEGDDASWVDGEAVHADCAEDAGVEVYD